MCNGSFWMSGELAERPAQYSICHDVPIRALVLHTETIRDHDALGRHDLQHGV